MQNGKRGACIQNDYLNVIGIVQENCRWWQMTRIIISHSLHVRILPKLVIVMRHSRKGKSCFSDSPSSFIGKAVLRSLHAHWWPMHWFPGFSIYQEILQNGQILKATYHSKAQMLEPWTVLQLGEQLLFLLLRYLVPHPSIPFSCSDLRSIYFLSISSPPLPNASSTQFLKDRNNTHSS